MNPWQINQATQKIQGYNAGFEKAVSTFQEIILVMFTAQMIQIFTHRLLYREKPFAVTLNDPFSGEELWCYGSERQLEGRSRRVVKLIDQSAFTLGLMLSAFLVIQLYFPAYTWSATPR